ncbi:hypothetical protein O6H91_08G010500 [Diphasiastrum complanatum]|uniref:Uncharacterized protein n=1 Tax=Diphasiastrum complanatum TaxID=34168 RepID=A0ACC2CVT8_DIPCM|nr:hypothetical protein O6H91_08G010500 [Diphasiastrum complanatum]
MVRLVVVSECQKQAREMPIKSVKTTEERAALIPRGKGSKLSRPATNMFFRDDRSLSEWQKHAREMPIRSMKATEERAALIPCGETDGAVVEEIDDATAEDDAVCVVCGVGGDAIYCETCPSISHPDCLGLQDFPLQSWFCFTCQCAICGLIDFHDSKFSDKETAMFNCAQCERKYHSACLEAKNRQPIKDLSNGNSFCGKSCRRIFYGLRNLVGKSAHIPGNLSWTLVRSSEEPESNTDKINKLLSAALDALLECFYPIVDSFTNIEMISHVLYNKPSKYRRLNFCGFYTLFLHEGSQIITVATIRVHGAHFAEMPFIGTRFEYQGKGMCRVLVNILERILKKLKVERLVVPAISELEQTWQKSFGFQPLILTNIFVFININVRSALIFMV